MAFFEFFGILRLKKYFFSKKNFKNNFFEKFFFPNFYNSCSLNIFEPKIWRRLGTFSSCLILRIDAGVLNHLKNCYSSTPNNLKQLLLQSKTLKTHHCFGYAFDKNSPKETYLINNWNSIFRFEIE